MIPCIKTLNIRKPFQIYKLSLRILSIVKVYLGYLPSDFSRNSGHQIRTTPSEGVRKCEQLQQCEVTVSTDTGWNRMWACAFGRCGYGRKALVVFLCASISVRCENRVSLCLPLFSLWYSPPSEGGTISRGNCAPSEGEGVSENVATSLYAVAEASYSFGRSKMYMRFGYPFGRSRRVKVSGNRATMLVGYCSFGRGNG